MAQGLTLLLITAAANQANAQNPPTNYTPQTVPYNGSEAWYCEDVTHTANKQCRVVDFIASISSLANLISAPLLTGTGTITTGGVAGSGFSLNAGTITWVGTIPNSAFSAAYTIPFPISSGGTGTSTPAPVAGNGISFSGSWPNQTISATTGAAVLYKPSTPTGTTSASMVMMGLGSTCVATPTKTGVMLLIIQGVLQNSGNNFTSVIVGYGTGVAPSNGATPVGTTPGYLQQNSFNGTSQVPFNYSLIISGLALNTQIWFDAEVKVTGGTGTVAALTCMAMEQ
jgi:hypothetical protein